MFELIEKIRQKPENIKKRIALLTALSFALFIFIIWLAFVLPGIKDREMEKSLSKEEKVEVTPISGLTGGAYTGWSGIKNNFSLMKENIKTFMSGVEYYSTEGPKN